MPVAVPLFARPAMLIAGFSVAADRGLSTYGIALLLSIALLVVLTAASPFDDPERPVLVWVGRVLSFVAVAGGALLIADAVFDI
jgi:hypothetical protein